MLATSSGAPGSGPHIFMQTDNDQTESRIAAIKRVVFLIIVQIWPDKDIVKLRDMGAYGQSFG